MEPPFSMITPNFVGNNVTDAYSLTTTTTIEARNSEIDPVNGSPPSTENNEEKNLSSGHSLRRGIFNFQPQSQKYDQGNKPATINIQIPGKLPFNPFNLFNMDTLKSLVQSVTENLTGGKKGYSTGFDDSVTIISEDPERPVPRAINSPVVNTNSYSNNINNFNNNHHHRQGVVPFIRLPTTETQAPPFQSTQQMQQHNNFNNQQPSNQNHNLIMTHNNNNNQDNSNNHNKHETVLENPNAHFYHHNTPTQLPPPPSQQLPGLLTEESMINKQMETLNEVLTHEMSNKGQRISTTIAPLTFPFLPDLSALSQLFNWGEQGARTLAVCNACRVGFGLFVSRVSKGITKQL